MACFYSDTMEYETSNGHLYYYLLNTDIEEDSSLKFLTSL